MITGNKPSFILQRAINSALLSVCLAFGMPVLGEGLTNIAENVNDVSVSGDGRIAVFRNSAGTGPRVSYRALDDDAESIGIAPDSNHRFGDVELSDDGRFIVFSSSSPDLVPDDTNGRDDIFLHDTVLGVTTRVSVSSTGTQGNNHSRDAGISADGQFIVFMSFANNLTADSNPGPDIFLYEVAERATRKVSIDSDGRETIGSNSDPVISADGNFIAFTSSSSEYTITFPFDSNGGDDIYMHSVADGSTVKVSTDVTQTRSDLNPEDFITFDSRSPSLSADGRFVLYLSVFIPSFGEPPNHNNLFSLRLRDTVARVTTDVIVGVDGLPADFDVTGAMLSTDGRFVVYESAATNLLPVPVERQNNIFLTDLYTSETVLVTAPPNGERANAFSTGPSISADGSRVVFRTLANNLVPFEVDPNQTGRTLAVLFENNVADAEAPEPLIGPSDNCQYFDASNFQGWGWDPVARESCPPLESLGCDYSQADIHDGWGWDAGTGMSCDPL